MKRAIIVVLLLVVVGAGVGAWYTRRGQPEIEVNTVPITRGDIVDTVGATGTLQAVTTVQVGSQVSGNIQWLGADFNSIVKKGQVIARLDPSLFDAQLQQVQANLSQARANLTRARSELDRANVALTDAKQKHARAIELSSRQLLAASELDAAKVAVDSAAAAVASQQASVVQSQAAVTQSEASVNQSRVNRDHTIIMAPIDGIVTQRSVDVGQTVAASMSAPTLFVIAADLTEMQVNANIDEADVGRIRPGQHVTFKVDAYPTDDFHWHRDADPAAAGGRAERHDVRHGHHRAQHGAQAQAGHDGERQDRDCQTHQRVAHSQRRAALPSLGRSVRGAQSNAPARSDGIRRRRAWWTRRCRRRLPATGNDAGQREPGANGGGRARGEPSCRSGESRKSGRIGNVRESGSRRGTRPARRT